MNTPSSGTKIIKKKVNIRQSKKRKGQGQGRIRAL